MVIIVYEFKKKKFYNKKNIINGVLIKNGNIKKIVINNKNNNCYHALIKKKINKIKLLNMEFKIKKIKLILHPYKNIIINIFLFI